MVLRVSQANPLSLYAFSIRLISMHSSLYLYFLPPVALVCIFLLGFSRGHKGQLCSISKPHTSMLAPDWIHTVHFLHQKMENLVSSPSVLGISVTVLRQAPECHSLLLLSPPLPLLYSLHHSSSLILIYNLHRSCHGNLNVFCLISLNSSVLFCVTEEENVATLWDFSGYKGSLMRGKL